jgi:MFS family permease
MRSWPQSGPLSGSQFRWFYAGQTISLFGSAMTPVALAFAVLQVRNGQHLLGYILAAEIVPEVLLVLIGGTIADRCRRDALIRLANLGAGVSQAGVAVVVLAGFSPYWIFPMATLNGGLAAFTSPAMRGIVPQIVAGTDIRRANSMLSTSRSVAKIAGPAVAGILVATIGGGWGIGLDAASFIVAAAYMTRVKIPSRPEATGDSLISQMCEGWSYFRDRRWIWSVTAACTLMNAAQIGIWQVLGPIIASHTFGSAGWGFTQTVKAAGVLAASLALLRVRLRRPIRDGLIFATAAGLPMVILGQGWPLPWLMAAAGLAGAGTTVFAVAWDTSLQQAVPQDRLSRVCAFDDFGSYVAIPAVQISVIPLVGIFGFHDVVTTGGLAFIVIALVPLLFQSVRRMRPADVPVLDAGATQTDPVQVAS